MVKTVVPQMPQLNSNSGAILASLLNTSVYDELESYTKYIANQNISGGAHQRLIVSGQ